MLVQLLVFYSPLIYTGISAEDDLEIVGSDNHLAFVPKVKDDGSGDTAGYYHIDGAPGKFDFTEHEDPPDFNYPVKTVQRFKDADGNIKIVTSYSNRDDNPLPIYKDVALRQKGLEQARAAKSEGDKETKDKTEPVPAVVKSFVTTAAPRVDKFDYVAHIEPRTRPVIKEFSTTKTVKFPNKDGQLFADQHETSLSDGTSSSYNQKSSYKTNYKKPQRKVVQTSASNEANTKAGEKDKAINTAPLQEAGSSYVSDIDHVEVDGPSFDGGGEGYAEGSSSYSSGGSDFADYGRGGDEGPAVYEAVDDGGYAGGVEDHGGSAGVYHGRGGGGDIAHHGGGGVAHHGHSHGSAFKKGHGSSYHHGNKAAKGDEGGKGHAKKEHYEKGHSESHGHEAQKGGEKEESGGKTGHLDEANQYGKGHAEEHGGGQKAQGHSKGHKKGHKTKGFRTVHHKDEYKKDEVFYDDEHDAGYQKGHGQHHHSHKKVKGDGHKKGHLNSGYKHGQKGFKGDKEKGHSYQNAKGHAGSSGHSHHKGHQSHFDKAAGHKGGEAHGHEHYKKGH